MNSTTSYQHYAKVAQALEYLHQHRSRQPSLEDVAQAVALSPHHLQRVFQRWAGISPKQFLQYLTRQHALSSLKAGQSVLSAALDSGLSGPGRLHDLLIKTDAITPGEARRGASGTVIQFGFGGSPFGDTLVAWSARGLCFLAFAGDNQRDSVLEALRQQWSGAEFHENRESAGRWLDRIFSPSRKQPLPLWLRGSPFQLKVWEALLQIPASTCASYGDIAGLISQPQASRAVGTAVGRNPIAWLIPCHRVIRAMGDFGAYRWGSVTKQAMLGWEQARMGNQAA